MFCVLFIALSLNITKISHNHIDWDKRSKKNCYRLEVGFSTDFDFNKTDSVSLVAWIKDNIEERNETYHCQIVAQKQGVCILSFSEINREEMPLFFYLNQSNEALDGIRSPAKMSSLKINTQKKPFTITLLKKYRYEFRYEGEMIEFGNST